ncbi:MAG: glycosyltransferase [Kiritimatiellae bacterium]|nr:glycosyltransferase [Kiritimatiellia bacterium]
MTGGVQEANGMRVAEELLRANGVIPPDEVWVHGMWTPRVWKECLGALRAGRPLVRMTHGSLSPIYLERQSKWKKRLVSPIERALFARTARVVVTGPWEEEWCRRWGVKCPIQTVNLKQFFNLPQPPQEARGQSPRLKVLYLGRIHPLKGVDVLKEAVEGLDVDLRVESEVFGEEKERALGWCEVLVLPSMSENFGFVVAEALMHGKRVVATDGAPAWENQEGVAYVRGYRDAPHGEQVRLLREALKCEIMEGVR